MAKKNYKRGSVADYQQRIIDVMKEQGRYNEALYPQTLSVAISWRSLALAAADLDAIDSIIITEVNRYNQETIRAHPIIALHEKLQRSLERQMSQLGLTTADLSADSDSDPLVGLTQELIGINASDDEIIMPAR